MIVPQYWAESRIQHRTHNRQVTLRRLGWSDSSADDAQAHAEQRAQEALERLLRGEKLARREPKIPYNGAAGVPIREEVVSRDGASVVTRNAYGAKCLNTPDVLFADIDFAAQPSLRFTWAVALALLLLAGVAAWTTRSRGVGVALSFAALFLSGAASRVLFRARQALSGGEEAAARARIHRFLAAHPEWNLRVYRTPAGLRLLATHQTFDPAGEAVAACFRALGVDPVYAVMCRNQRCFRARVSAKPWRIGMPGHLRPRPGVWPVAPDRLPVRNAWIARYDELASGYAACTFVESLGSGTVHPEARKVQELHDALSHADSGRPIA